MVLSVLSHGLVDADLPGGCMSFVQYPERCFESVNRFSNSYCLFQTHNCDLVSHRNCMMAAIAVLYTNRRIAGPT